jgi:hypothetical protein
MTRAETEADAPPRETGAITGCILDLILQRRASLREDRRRPLRDG